MNSHPPAPALCVASIPHVSLPCPHSPGWKQGQPGWCPPKAAQPLAPAAWKAVPGPEEDREYLLSLLPRTLCSIAVTSQLPAAAGTTPLRASRGSLQLQINSENHHSP